MSICLIVKFLHKLQNTMASSNSLRAAVYRADITPPIGIAMCGYLARNGVSNGVERPLTATTLVLTNGSEKLCIVACDLIYIFNPEVDEIRQAIADRLGIGPEGVLINCSHTHCGPNVRDYSWEGPAQKQLQREYLANLKGLLAGCASVANNRLRPARLGTGFGTSHVGINRREVDENGDVILGENPGGPLDPTVGVIRIDEMSGKPLAIVFTYGCHTVTMGPKCLSYSPDYPGPAREVIERATGATTLFLQAAGGNINPITGIGANEDDSENMNRVGVSLSAEVLRVAMGIRTHEKRGERVIFTSLTRNSMYPMIPVEDVETSLGAVEEKIALPLVNPPSLDEARQILKTREGLLASARAKGTPEHNLRFYMRFCDWARFLVQEVEAGKKTMSVPVHTQALRIGNLAIASAAGETLVELGLQVRQKSPFPETLFLGYSNGCIGYIPSRNCYPDGGWSASKTYYVPDMLCQSYMLPMHVAPEAGEILVKGAVNLIGKLA